MLPVPLVAAALLVPVHYKVGQKCSLKYEATYTRSHYTCLKGKLAKEKENTRG